MASGGRDVERRTWDREVFRKKAEERARAEKEAELGKNDARKAGQRHAHIDGDPFAPTRAWLQKRPRTVDFEAKVGTTEVVGSAQAGGYVCKVCDVTLKDSNRYLAHMNSRAHQKALGISMRVRRSTVEEVREAFRKAVEERDREKERKALGDLTVEERVQRRREERKRRRAAAGP